MRREVASFHVDLTSYVDADGTATADLPAFASDPAELATMYRAMMLTRTFDAKAVALQRTGRLGTFASSLGQEAVAVGIGAAMAPDDVFVPSFREHGAMFMRGVEPGELLLYWGGDERGSDYARQRHDFPICVPIGTQAAHAVGVALAFALRGLPRAALCTFGDGATSRGDVYESMNFAGVRRLPVVFVANNNQWAISVPRRTQSAAETLAQKAIAAGITGEQVDGNDVIAMRAVIAAALDRARSGGGPTLVEALTYRLTDHTTADDASRYRSDDEVSEHWKADPVGRLRDFMVARGWWGREQEEHLHADCTAAIEQAVRRYEAYVPMPASSMFDHLYAVLPHAYERQRDELVAGERSGG
ncbi:MAG TPA: pyruvate dehydrogenase (acetyl-transferring) E1 component subunit alpha [Ilumatobacter sp.]